MVGRLQALADRLRLDAERTGDPTLASLARVIDALSVFVSQGPTEGELAELERHLARFFAGHGVPLTHERTVRLGRPPNLGSPRAELAREMVADIAQLAVPEDIAGTITMTIVMDWPATPELRALSYDEIKARVLDGVRRVKSSDPERLVRAALRALGASTLGLTDSQIRGLFGFENAAAKRKA